MMKLSDNCSYCSEMHGDHVNSYFLSEISGAIGLKSRYLFKSDSFIVFPSVGALTPGHLLIAPKQHITAMALLEDAQVAELNSIITELKDILYHIYNVNILAMEHGVLYESTSTGACVNHAHIHIMPSDVDLLSAIQTEKHEILISQIQRLVELNDDYLLITNECKQYFYSKMGDCPAQYLRKVIFNSAGLEGSWNWRNDCRLPVMKKTIEDISTFITNTGSDYFNFETLIPTALISPC